MAVTSSAQPSAIHKRPAELLQDLLRFDTTNPPGNEAECVAYINGLLGGAGVPTTLLARDPGRPNLIARLPGEGKAPPLLLHGHVDVVTTANQVWREPPFEGRLVDGWVWGRGALDMKGGVAMMLAAVMRAKLENAALPGDVILVVLSDEEAGSDYGACFLTEEHAGLFEGVRYAIGEGGGSARYVDDQRFYPIMAAEKQICWIRATVRGPGGHAARPMRGGAMARLAGLLQTLDTNRLPVHVSPVARRMLETMAPSVSAETGGALSRLADPTQTDSVLDGMGQMGLYFDPMLHNTVNATIVHGGHKINVIPSEITVEMDGRLLPGYGPDDMLAELGGLIGDEVELEVLRHDQGGGEPKMRLYDTLAAVLREADPEGVPVPMLLPAVTDGRYWARLGIEPYGFLPLNLPETPDPARLIHAADERVPAESLTFGAEVLYKLLQRFGEPA